MNDAWKQRALRMRSQNNEAIAAAHVDAGSYGKGYIEVDEMGNLKRVHPKNIQLKQSQKGNQND